MLRSVTRVTTVGEEKVATTSRKRLDAAMSETQGEQGSIRSGIELPRRVATSVRAAYRAYHHAASRRPMDDAKREDRLRAGVHLAAVVKAGRETGWPWKVMASHCTPDNDEPPISAERLRQIAETYDPASQDRPDAVGSVPRFPRFENKVEQRRKKSGKGHQPTAPARGSMTAEERDRFAELSQLVRRNNGTSALDSPQRLASEEFSDMILNLKKRRVTWREMAEASGHTESGLRRRAARFGYGSLPPSVKPYQQMVVRTVSGAEQAIVDSAQHRDSA